MSRIRCKKCGAKFGNSLDKCLKCGSNFAPYIKLRRYLLWIVPCLFLVIMFVWGSVLLYRHTHPLTLQKLMTMTPQQLAKMDIAEMNLLCAQGLPGAQDLNIKRCLHDLDEWAAWTKHETERHLYRLQTNPTQYRNSEAYFRVSFLTQVLGEDFRIRYNKDLLKSGAMADLSSLRFFRDFRDIFIHGLLSDKRTGSCSGMPVLVTAVGRRLGYPIKLVCARAHLFCRWDSSDGKDRVNVETQGEGFSSHPDEYYTKWPFPITDKEIQDGFYLKSLTPAEELAVFLELRACCLLENGRYEDAILACERALQLMPQSPGTQKLLVHARFKHAQQNRGNAPNIR